MSIPDNFSQWSKLDTKNQRASPTNIDFPMVNRKKKKKKMPYKDSFILSING